MHEYDDTALAAADVVDRRSSRDPALSPAREPSTELINAATRGEASALKVDIDAPFVRRDTDRYDKSRDAHAMATISDFETPKEDFSQAHVVRVTADHKIFGDETIAGPAASPDAQRLPQPGDLIADKFEIVRAIGRGGMGHVYLGRDLDLGRYVAIKIMRLQHSDEARRRKMMELFKREARATARLNHPNVVTIHQVGQWRDQPYLVLELLRGGALSEQLGAGPLPLHTALKYLAEVCRALIHAHDAQLVHRDLKPGNIFLTAEGVVKVLDFGLAQLEPIALPHAAPVPEGMRTSSRNSTIAGSPAYMAPEQWYRGELDRRTDIWACGVVLYQMLLDALPFSSPRAVMDGAAPPRIDALRRDIPAPVAELVERCLQLKPSDRFDSATELLDAVLDRLSTLDDGGLPDGEPYRFLESFNEQDAPWFFGREREVTRLSLMLQQRAVVGVVGASGAGKTSLIRAGLIPTLRGSRSDWTVLTTAPGRTPYATLVQRIREICPMCSDAADERGALTANNPGRVGFLLRNHASHSRGRVLLVVDQFEELFTQVDDIEERRAFCTALLAAADDPDGPIKLIVSMREDFLTRLIEAPQLRDAVAGNLLPLGSPDTDSIREALCGPARRFGYTFEESVVDAVLYDLRGEPAPLPMLQFAVSQLWERRDRDTRVIGQAMLDEIGGVAGVLAVHAESLFHGLSEEREIPAARDILLELVTEHGTKRRMDRAALINVHPDPPLVESVLDLLVRGRLITSSKQEGVETVQLAHESLIARWQRLRRWLSRDEELRRFREGVREAAARWRTHDEQTGMLWTGEIHAEARRWRARWKGQLTPDEVAFLDAADTAADRTKTLRRWASGIALVTAAIVAVGSTFGMLSYRDQSEQARSAEQMALAAESEAKKNAAVAESARRAAQASAAEARAAHAESVSKVVAAYASLTKERDPLLGLLLAREAVEASPTAEAMTALHTTLRMSRQRAVIRGGAAAHIRAAWLGSSDRFLTWGSGETTSVRAVNGGPPVRFPAGDGVAFAMPLPERQRVALIHTGRGVSLVNLLGVPVSRIADDLAPVSAAAFSRGGRWFTTGSNDGTVAVWTVDKGAKVAEFAASTEVTSVLWSPDNKRIAIGTSGGPVLLCDRITKSAMKLRGHSGAVTALAYAGAERLLSAGHDGVVRVWSGGRTVQQLRGHTGWITALVVSADGQLAATSSYDETARLWDLGSGKSTVLRGHQYIVSSVSLSPIDDRVLTTSFDGSARIWRRSGKVEAVLTGHTRPVLGGAFSGDGANALTWSDDGTARVWRTADEEIYGARATGCSMGGATTDASGRFVVTLPDLDLTRDCEVEPAQLWQVGVYRPLPLRSDSPAAVARFAPDSQSVVTGHESGEATSWSVDGKVIAHLTGHTAGVRAVAFAKRDGMVVTASDDGTARRWSADGTSDVIFAGHNGPVVDVKLCGPNGDHVVTASADTRGRIWSLTGKAVTWLAGHKAPMVAVECSRDGLAIVTLDASGEARVWQQSGEPHGPLDVSSGPFVAVGWSADDRVVGLTKAGRVAVHRKDGQPLASFDTAVKAQTLSVHPTLPILVAGSRDGVARLWHLDGQLHSTIVVGKASVLAAAFTHDGKRALLAARDAGAHLVAIQKDSLLAIAKTRSLRELSRQERRKYGLLGQN